MSTIIHADIRTCRHIGMSAQHPLHLVQHRPVGSAVIKGHVVKQAVAASANDVIEPGSVLEPYGLVNASVTWRNIAKTR